MKKGERAMRYPQEDQIIWQFDTANFRIVCHVDAEDIDPADSFEHEDDIAFAREDDPAHWFYAVTSVWLKDHGAPAVCIGWDTLGGCSYRSFDDFISGHRSPDPENRNTLAMKTRKIIICHYFPGMIGAAIHAARQEWTKRGGIKLREAA